MDAIAVEYSKQSGGGTLPYFQGKQHGSGWVRSIGRFAFPIVKSVLGLAGNVAANTAQDLLENKKDLKTSLKDNALNEARRLIKRKLGSSSSINTVKKRHGKKKRKHISKRDTIFAS